jgi:DNA-directed RNA polymerase subunit RPC12/RpoP
MLYGSEDRIGRMSLTEEQEEKYLKSDGSFCPYCGSENLEHSFYNSFAEGEESPVRCKACGKKWTDIYYLVLMEIQEEEEEEEDYKELEGEHISTSE